MNELPPKDPAAPRRSDVTLVPRRTVLALAAAALALPASAWAGTTTAATCEAPELVYVGNDQTELSALRFDACSGALTPLGSVAQLPKPRWILPHPLLPVLYVAHEGKDKEGAVSAFTMDRRNARLTPLNDAPAGGAGTTFLALDVASMTLFTANFGAGSAASLALRPDGRLDAPASTRNATGSGPHRRQTSPHAHGIAIDPSGRFALVADMGADRVFVYGFDRATHTLVADDASAARTLVMPAGSGPRRAVFGVDGRFVHVLNELTADVVTLRWDEASGRLTPLQTLPLSSPDFKGPRSASEIATSRDGRFVYIGDRGENMLLVYRMDAAAGGLSLVQRVPSGGDAPWAFDLHPSGRWLLVANYRSNRLQLFGVDPATGRMSDTGRAIDSTAPVSIAFVN